jgi:hypothetical protein
MQIRVPNFPAAVLHKFALIEYGKPESIIEVPKCSGAINWKDWRNGGQIFYMPMDKDGRPLAPCNRDRVLIWENAPQPKILAAGSPIIVPIKFIYLWPRIKFAVKRFFDRLLYREVTP